MAFVQTVFQAYAKAKKAGKFKKRRQCDYDSNSSSDSEQETGCNNTIFSLDKRLKLVKLLGTVYITTEACSIKVVKTAPSKTIRADNIAIETAKTSKVTAVVTVMSIL